MLSNSPDVTKDRPHNARRPLVGRRRARLIAMAAGITLSMLLLDLVLITHNGAQLREQFARLAKPQEQLLAGYADSYISHGDILGLTNLLQTSVVGDLLYGQVVVDGQVLAERLAPKVVRTTLPIESLPPDSLESAVVRRLPSGESYLDVRLGLTRLANPSEEIAKSNPTTTYLRLGYSMISVDLEVGRYSVFVLGVSGLLLVAIGLLFWAITQVFRRRVAYKPTDTLEPVTSPVAEYDEGLGADRNGAGTGAAVKMMARRLQLRGGPIILDEGRKQIRFDGQLISLSPKEYKLFMQLASDPTRIFSDEEIIREVWGAESFATSKDVKQYIYFVRRKLADDSEVPRFIETVRGHGYKLAL